MPLSPGVAAVVGLIVGLAMGHRRSSGRAAVLATSYAAAFGAVSALVTGYEVVYGTGLAQGAGWALWYSPINLALAVAGSLFCVLGIRIRRRCSGGRPPAGSPVPDDTHGGAGSE
jgi:hypothetical protein